MRRAALIDLHCHLLPEIDDGAKSVAESLEMARVAVADGISVVACTPHILPGVYDNKGPEIRAAVERLQRELDRESIPLSLEVGADVHMAPDLLEGLKSGRVPSLAGSRYVLLEPPSSVMPPRFEHYLFGLLSAGYVPIVTHPERLGWPLKDYDVFRRIVHLGAWLQLTGGSLLGRFGPEAQGLAERLVCEGLVHIIASDAHGARRRAPVLTAALNVAKDLIGEAEAFHLVGTRPAGILQNIGPDELPAPAAARMGGEQAGD